MSWDEVEDFGIYYMVTLTCCIASILGSCYIIFIECALPKAAKLTKPKFLLISRQAIDDLLYVITTLCMFGEIIDCRYALGVAKLFKNFSLCFAINLSLFDVSLCKLNPKVLISPPWLVFESIISIFFATIYALSKDFGTTDCISAILETDTEYILINNLILIVASFFCVIKIICQIYKSIRHKESLHRNFKPMLLIAVWFVDFIIVLVEKGQLNVWLLSFRLGFSRSIGIANWIIYRKNAEKMKNAKLKQLILANNGPQAPLLNQLVINNSDPSLEISQLHH